MKKYTLAISVSAFMLLATAGVIWYAVQHSSGKKVAMTNSETTSSSGQQLGVSTDRSATQQSQGLSLDNGSTQQGGLSLQSNLNGQSGSGSSGSGNSSSVPTPDQYSVYDQYKDSQNAMYMDLQVGNGEEAVSGSQAVVLYKGWLTDGTLFDESRTNSQGQLEAFPFTLGSGQVIRGWEEGVLGMKVGGKRRLIVPPVAGYGEQGQGPIPGNAVLVFDVQLVQFGSSQ